MQSNSLCFACCREHKGLKEQLGHQETPYVSYILTIFFNSKHFSTCAIFLSRVSLESLVQEAQLAQLEKMYVELKILEII